MDNCMHGTDARNRCEECDEYISKCREAEDAVRQAERALLYAVVETDLDRVSADAIARDARAYRKRILDAREALKKLRDAAPGTIVPVY